MKYRKCGSGFGGTDRIINLGHPVETMVEPEKGGGVTNISSSHSQSKVGITDGGRGGR